MKKRIIALLLAFALLLGLTGCKEEEDAAKLAFQTSPYYTQEEMSLPVAAGELEGCCTDGASFYYLVKPGEAEALTLCRAPLDGGEAEVLAEYQSPVEDEDTTLGLLGPVWGGDGKLWMWEQLIASGYDLPEDFDPETGDRHDYYTGITETFRMRQLDPATGKELQTVDVTAAMAEIRTMQLGGVAVDGLGTIYLADQKKVVALDSQGQTLFTLKADLPGGRTFNGAGGSLALLPDGTTAALTVQPGEKREVRTIDAANKTWGGKKYAIQPGVNELYNGGGACLFYHVSGDVVYGMVEGEELPQRLLPWSNAQLESASGVKCFALLEEGRAVALSSVHEPGTGQFDDKIRAIRLLPSEEAPEDAKVKLVYGIIGENVFARQRVNLFNRKSDAYWIEVRDYAEGMLAQGEKNDLLYQNAAARLFTDISSGKGPDILDGSAPLEALGRQGALEDLWPWIDQDPDVSRETVMTHVLECAETQGKLYRVCGGFEIETAVASAAVAGGRTGWTMEELLAAYGGGMPEMYFGGSFWSRLLHTTFNRFGPGDTLYNLVSMNLDRYINWETGECVFDGEDFKALLEISGSMEEVENSVDLTDKYVRSERGIWNRTAAAAEACRVLPWENDQVLYARTLSDPQDLVLDDVLFSGRDGLVEYEQRLWDADILYTFLSPVTEKEVAGIRGGLTRSNSGFGAIKSAELDGSDGSLRLSGDVASGGADKNIYAAFPGFPSQSGCGSSFSLYDCVGISAASEAKEGAWAFARTLLLPDGNTIRWNESYALPTVHGFAMNRETLEEQLACQYWVNEETGEYFLDPNGEPVEYSEYAIGAGDPGDIVLMAYLFAPSEAQLERFWNLYNAIDHVTGEDDELLDIIVEQAQPYFAGDKSLDETAQLIQNRVKLYVNENR